MKTIPRMTSEQESRLLSSLDQIMAEIDGGANSADAITKVAGGMELPPGHIELLVRAFNTGQAQRQQAADDYTTKAADYEVIDPQHIVERLFPKTVKTAGVPVSEDYLLSPQTWLATPDPVPEFSKAASEEPAAPQVLSPVVREKRAQILCDNLERNLAERSLAVLQLEERAGHALNKLANYFGPHGYVPGRYPAHSVHENATLLWGPYAGQILESVTTVKTASFRHVHPVDQTAEPYAPIRELLDVLPELKEKQAALAVAKDWHQQWIDRNPFLFTKWERTKQASGGGLNLPQVLGVTAAKDVIGQLADQMHQNAPEDLVRRELQNLSTPEHETELRDISQRAMLQDLLVNDPVLSRHDPYELADGFNSLSMMAPQAMANPEMARSILRRRMEAGGLEPFELQSLTSINNNLRQPMLGIPGAPKAPSGQGA